MPIDNKSAGPEISKWRRRLERRGWIGLRRSKPPTGEWIEFHVIWKGWLYSVVAGVGFQTMTRPTTGAKAR